VGRKITGSKLKEKKDNSNKKKKEGKEK